MLKDLVGLDRKIERARAETQAEERAKADAEIARLKTRIDELERDRR